MLNAGNSTLTTLSATLETLEQNASLDEKITTMEAFISMLSSCSDGSLGQEMSVSSMWADATQTLSVAMGHRKKVGITRRKMETLWEEDLVDRAEMEYLRLAMSGLNLSWHQVEKSFLTCARAWLLGHFSVISPHSGVTLTGNTAMTQLSTDTLTAYYSGRTSILDSIRGYNKTWEDAAIPVSAVMPVAMERPLAPSGRLA